jgi:hypothetical protein
MRTTTLELLDAFSWLGVAGGRVHGDGAPAYALGCARSKRERA